MIATFQAIVQSFVVALSELFPLGGRLVAELFSPLVGWAAPSESILAVVYWGIFVGCLIPWIHDWVGVLSSFFRILLDRRLSHGLDERLLFWICIAQIPALVVRSIYGTPEVVLSTPWVGLPPLFLLGMAFVLRFLLSYSRQHRGLFDWSALDALGLGICLLGFWVSGVGLAGMALAYSLARNLSPEAYQKLFWMSALPQFLLEAVRFTDASHLWSAEPLPGLSMLTAVISLAITTVLSAIITVSMVQQAQRREWAVALPLRFLLGVGGVALFGYRWWFGS